MTLPSDCVKEVRSERLTATLRGESFFSCRMMSLLNPDYAPDLARLVLSAFFIERLVWTCENRPTYDTGPSLNWMTKHGATGGTNSISAK